MRGLIKRWPVRRRHATRSAVGLVLAAAGSLASAAPAHRPAAERLIIQLQPSSVLSFRPEEAIGAGIDGSEAGGSAAQLSNFNVAQMKRAGLRPLTYRLRTELGEEVWHWNPAGQWSDPARRQGYWTSSDTLGGPIRLSWGYRLPRRGDTFDQANNKDYSRLTDGDRATFWKSDPYLDPGWLGDGVDHPQWVVVRLGQRRPTDAAVLDWAVPYAVDYEVQHWTGAAEDDGDGRWVTFPGGSITSGSGGSVRLRLSPKPVSTAFIRILLHRGSGTAPPGSTDWRDHAGFALREVSFGVVRPDGRFEDAVVHAPSHARQTVTHVSSTDPWHRESDRDRNLEQTGVDRIFASGLGFGLPVMMPAGLLYNTPENAAAELRYLAARRYPVRRVELGEEPDGQYASAADYGALYLAYADRLGGLLPGAEFGGPSLQSAFTDTWMQPEEPHAWDAWLVRYLRDRRRLSDVRFVSFEFYPFDDICGELGPKLIGEEALLRRAWQRLSADGWPQTTPRLISEYGFSAYSGRAESELPSALLMSGIVGQWLSLGGSGAYMFGYPPATPSNQHQPCAGYGNMMLFLADRHGQAVTPMPSFYAAGLLTSAWTAPGPNRVLPSTWEGGGEHAVAAFAIRRPDRRLSVLLINRSARRTDRLEFFTRDAAGSLAPLNGPAQISIYGPANYSWIDGGKQSHPGKDLPPTSFRASAGPLRISLPPYTIAVATVG